MQPIRFYYIIKLQYLGFRYHGWQKQPKLKTVERMVERTLKYVLKEEYTFKILAMGRTDAKVSVNESYIELFIDDKPLNTEEFFPVFNRNLPQDIRALEISETTADFNIIQHPMVKEYMYFFSFGAKFHPFCAPLMTNVVEDLDIELMQKAVKCFEGKHDFWSYTFRPTPYTQTISEVLSCEIVENEVYTANFFPEKSYVMKVKAEGFKRYQIRLMMGALINLGLGEMDIEFFKKTIDGSNRIKLTYVAPASGLILNSVEFLKEEKEI